MDGLLLDIFQAELKNQCRQADVAAEQLDAALRDGDQIRIWVALQSILVTAGNVAKLLWGSGGRGKAAKTEADREPLRALAGVSGKSPLKARDVRNAFEHFDEKIMAWHAADTTVYASRQVTLADDWPHGARLGHYNPKTGIVTFLDHSVSIRELMDELHRILEALSPQ